MKIFIWRTLPWLKQWQDGIAFAIAENVDDAREALIQYHDKRMSRRNYRPLTPRELEEFREKVKGELLATPEEHDLPYAEYFHGSA